MAEQTDPMVVRWSNEQLRPISDLLVKLEDACQQMQVQYNGGVSAAMAAWADSDVIMDGQTTGGGIPMTKARAVSIQGQVNTQLATMQVAFYMDNLRLACRRSVASL